MSDHTYPFIEDFLRAKKGTIYALSDAQVRVRDAHAILALVRFFSAHGVDVDLRTVLAAHTRTFAARDLGLLFQDESGEAEAARILSGGGSVGARIQDLFRTADRIRRERISQPGSSPAGSDAVQLASRGPVLLLGRPSAFPETLRLEIQRELGSAGRPADLEGRFRLVSKDPYADSEGYRTILDTYSGSSIPPLLFPEDGSSKALHSDHAIVRAVRGRFPFRSFLFAYGPGSLGTLAAAQTLVDRELNAELVSLGIVEFLDRHQFVEVLLEANQSVDPRQPWQNEFAPNRITPRLRPIAPPPPAATAFLTWLDSTLAGPADFEGLYRRVQADEGDERLTIECLPGPPDTDGTNGRTRVWRMVGGRKIQRVVAELRKTAREDTRMPVFLVGETGVGKEIAARIIFEEVAVRLLRLLGKGTTVNPPVVPGPRFVAINCAALTETLTASELFGIAAGVATGVTPHAGPLVDAGEGVVLLDEIESMRLADQATLLRTLDHPYVVTPVGTSARVPVSALVVAATNVEPDRLVSSDGMRMDLYGRLQPRMIRIPPLRERREDIPALLAFLAGGDVLIARTALTALLLHEHPLNVRGLLPVLERARRRQPQALPLSILTEDLDGTMAALASDLFGGQTAGESGLVRFRAERTGADLGRLFEGAVEVLGSFCAEERGGRWHAERRTRNNTFDSLWSLPKAARDDQKEEFVTRYVELIEAACRQLRPGDRESSRALRMLGELFPLVWPDRRAETATVRLLGSHVKSHAVVKRTHLAMAVGSTPSALSQLLASKDDAG